MGDPQGVMQILSPANGDALGLQFSAYGTCDAITPSHNPPMTATLMNGTTPVQSTATVNNQQNGTWEAVFSLPFDPGISRTGSIEITCSGMTCTPVTGLTVTNQDEVLTFEGPLAAQLLPHGDAVERGTIASGYSLKSYVTQAGSRFDGPPQPNVDAVTGVFRVNLHSLDLGSNYVLHFHAAGKDGQPDVRMSTAFFNVVSPERVKRG